MSLAVCLPLSGPLAALGPAAVRPHGMSAICTVDVLDYQSGSARPPAATGPIQAGALMFSWTAS
ncbi:hypothetical protein AB0D27_44075 [Streptomyces sp. NPDC048415]|uniref:hypothetical protein n=1 Tax=Streptomyces sp. NPDC048415 TaxID=3154822 RepID=UPI00342D17AB